MARITRVLLVGAALALVVAGTPAASAGGGSKRTVIVFNGEGNNLNAYEAKPPFEKQTVITNHNDDPDGLDINAQICFFPKGAPGPEKGERWFIAGEDTGQPDPPPGWGIFQLKGTEVGKLSAEQVGKLTPTYQPTEDNSENYGCGFLSDGRVVTTDIGNQAAGDSTGQLIVWFPPFDSRDVAYCKLDVAIGTAGQIYVDDQDRIYVASALRETAGVLRYTGPFPTSNDAEGGCGQTDTTGAPLADAVERELFIAAGENGLSTPNAVIGKPGGGLYVDSVITGVINEYDEAGGFVRTILAPPAGEVLGEQTFSTGTPLGLGVDSKGTLYYADIGITITPEAIGPGAEGTVRRIRFVDSEPQPPELMGGGLAFPDGIGVLEVKKKG
ncbi:MAG: hypothetical protein H0V95_01160 [Actinobacteria bacterium]|nr:hypothetical protein [Actinomycetota bacterium]